MAARDLPGGTSPAQVKQALEAVILWLKEEGALARLNPEFKMKRKPTNEQGGLRMSSMSLGAVKKQLKMLYKSRDQYMLYIGQLAFEEYKNQQLPNEALQEPCATLEEVYEQVGLWEEQLNVLRT